LSTRATTTQRAQFATAPMKVAAGSQSEAPGRFAPVGEPSSLRRETALTGSVVVVTVVGVARGTVPVVELGTAAVVEPTDLLGDGLDFVVELELHPTSNVATTQNPINRTFAVLPMFVNPWVEVVGVARRWTGGEVPLRAWSILRPARSVGAAARGKAQALRS
jgi:hypothetical protein